jgi:hypothetical protein
MSSDPKQHKMETRVAMKSGKIQLNRCTNLAELSSGETMVLSENNRFQPELADHSLPLDVHVRRLVAIETIEVKPKTRAMAQPHL